ncbi:MAG: small ribosomal subunit Rsm22 family protein [Myxococcota bacterium]
MQTQADLDPGWEEVLRILAQQQHPRLSLETRALADKLAPFVRTLTEGLTRARALPGERYLDSPELSLAYLLYYVPVNATRTRAGLTEVWPPVEPLPSTLRMVDPGCGPGSQLIAVLDLLRELPPPTTGTRTLHYHGLDHSVRALEQLQGMVTLAQQHGLLPDWLELKLTLTRVKTPPTPAARALALRQALEQALSTPAHLLTLGYVLNELSVQADEGPWLAGLVQKLVPDGLLLLLEPALQETAERLCQLRDAVVREGGVTVRFPCTHHAACPLVGPQRPARQWCHQELRWQRPPLIQAIDARAGLDKVHPASSQLLLQRRAAPATAERGHYRALGPALHGRGTVTVHLCGAEGFQEATLLTRHRAPENEALLEVRRGDWLHLEGAEPKGASLRLGPQSRVEV